MRKKKTRPRFLLNGFKKLALYDLQLVIDRENSRNAVGSYASDIPVHLAVNHTHQGHMTVLHNNADRLLYAQYILLQRWIAIDAAEQSNPQTVVKKRHRQHLDLIVHALHAFNALYYIVSVAS